MPGFNAVSEDLDQYLREFHLGLFVFALVVHAVVCLIALLLRGFLSWPPSRRC